MSLLIVGSVAFDAIETPFGKTDKIIGGAGTYIAFSAAHFLHNIQLVSVVGEDFPKDTIALMEKKGIDTSGLQVKEGEKSFFWSGKYHDNMNSRDTLVTELNVLEHFDPILPKSYQACEYLMLGNLAPAVQNTVIERLEQRPKAIVLDTMNFWMDIAMDDLQEVIKKVDVLVINDEEARQLTGEYHLRLAAKKIVKEMGPSFLVIKKGEHGALLFDQEMKTFHCPALLLDKVFDPTGAGDTFAGALTAFIAKQDTLDFHTLKHAVLHGTALASFCVEEFGVQRILEITPKEIEERVEALKALMSL